MVEKHAPATPAASFRSTHPRSPASPPFKLSSKLKPIWQEQKQASCFLSPITPHSSSDGLLLDCAPVRGEPAPPLGYSYHRLQHPRTVWRLVHGNNHRRESDLTCRAIHDAEAAMAHPSVVAYLFVVYSARPPRGSNWTPAQARASAGYSYRHRHEKHFVFNPPRRLRRSHRW